MKKPTPSQFDAARRLVEHEGRGLDSAEDLAAAAQRVSERTLAHLATLLGSFGARSLFVRSLNLTAPEFPCLRKVQFSVEGDESLAEQIRTCLRGETPDVVTETTVALYATVLAVLETLIGDELTTTVLRDSWPPAFRADATEEETK